VRSRVVLRVVKKARVSITQVSLSFRVIDRGFVGEVESQFREG